MTEEEAKRRWCPSSGTAMDHPHGGCIASQCMAWRWSEGARQTDTMFWTKGDPEKMPEGSGWEPTEEPRMLAGRAFSRSWRRPHPARPGYCGLAGAPQ